MTKRTTLVRARAALRTKLWTVCAVALSCFLIGVTSADDTEIYSNAESVPPNVLFIVDVSGSMNWTDNSPLPDIPGQVLWLDANDRSTIFDARGNSASRRWSFSGNVAQWRDKSGKGHHLTGTSTTLGNINGRPTVRFTRDIMTGPDIFDGSMTEATIFMVQQENVSSNNFFLNFNGNSTRHQRVSFHTPWHSNRSWFWDAGGYRGNRTHLSRPTAVGEVTQMTAFKSVSQNKNGFILNNGAHSVTRTGATAATTSGGMYFGRNTSDHELAEIIAYDRMLSDAEIKQVQDYLDKKWRTRLERLKVALNALLENAEGFNAGLITYSSYARGQFALRDEIKPIEQSKQSLLKHINELYARGGTPTQSAMFEGMRYYRGEPPLAMGGLTSSGPPPSVQCQSNHIVLLTDGEPYGGASWPSIGNYIGSNCARDRGQNTARGNCGIELAGYMSANDHYPTIRGVNNITTHTIGLSLDMKWLGDMAAAGGGGYYSVGTSDQLLSAFQAIMDAAFDQSTTFVAPAVTIDQFSRLAHRDDTYLALFQPTNSMRWPGNLKRYNFTGNPPAIRDRNNKKVLNNSTGNLHDDAHSFWSNEVDGNSIIRGGAASKLDVSERRVTTYTGNGTSYLIDDRNRVHEDNASTLGSFVGAQGDELKSILAWARGMDVHDADNDGETTDTRHQMGDPLHSHPTILTYGGSSREPDSTIFIGTNEGYLHAVSSIDGTELYSFIPAELLGNLKTFYDDKAGFIRPYGLDGDITLWLDDKNHNGLLDSASEQAHLYVGMRRGGKNYYALNVTDKHNPKYLWTIKGGTDSDFAELGQTWSKPVKSKVRIGSDIKDVLIFGGGYDTNQDNAKTRTEDSTGNALFIVDALTGSLIWKTAMDTTSDYTQMKYSMPSDPRVLDVNGDGLANQIYIGDMGGQIWRFDVDDQAASAAKLVSGGLLANLATSDAEGNRRFFYPPDVSLISQEGQYYLSLAIGSGNRSHPLGRTVRNRFYMIRQNDYDRAPEGYGAVETEASASQLATYRPITEADLYDATANDIDSSNSSVSIAAKSALEDAYGWLLHLEESGEKVLGTSATIDSKIIFASYIPDTTGQSDDICKPATGGNRAYVVSLFDATPITGVEPSNRYQDIEQPGIAGTVSVIIDRGDENSPDSDWSVNAIIALDSIEMPAVPMMRRLYWSEYPDY